MPNFSKLFDFSYLLHPNPGKLFLFASGMLGFLALLVAAAITLFVLMRTVRPNPVLKRILRKVPMRFFAFGIVGLVLVLLRMGEAAYLSMRLWLVIWGMLFIWYVTTIVLQFQRYPADLEAFRGRMAVKDEKQRQWERLGKKKRRK